MSLDFNFPKIPYTAFIGLTYACNCECRHCYAKDRIVPFRKSMELQEYLELIKKLYELGVLVITYSHGETLLHADCETIFACAHKYGFHQVLISNGVLLSENKIRSIERVGIETLMLSLDSSRREDHDSNRGKGNYDAVMRAAHFLGKSKIIQKGFAVTINQQNQYDVDEIIDIALNFDLGVISLLTERGKHGIAKLDLSVLANTIKRRKNDISIITHDSRLLQYFDKAGIVEQKEQELFIADNSCRSYNSQISIDAYGDVRPCNFVNNVIGNCLSENIQDLWKKLVVSQDKRCCLGSKIV